MSGSSLGIIPASVHGSLADHDLIHGIVLPNLADSHPSIDHTRCEYITAEAKGVDFAALPVRMNHRNNLSTVGVTIGYRVYEEPGARPRAETLHKLHRELDSPPFTDAANVQVNQRNALMSGEHRGLSLGHDYTTEYVGECGRYDASARGQPGRMVRKVAHEISTCARGARQGSEILEYMPCRRSLRLSHEGAIRKFCDTYQYTPPPRDLTQQNTAEWNHYLDTLWSEVEPRRISVLSQPGYATAMRSRGIVLASGDNEQWLEQVAARAQPWTLVPAAISK